MSEEGDKDEADEVATERSTQPDGAAELGLGRPKEVTDGKRLRKQAETVELEWRDWVALLIASLQTILLPLVVFAVVLIIATTLFVFHPWTGIP